jgi:hypothetical protein
MFNIYSAPYWMFPPQYKGIMNYNFQAKILFNTEFLYDWLEEYGTLPTIFKILYQLPGTQPPELLPIVIFLHFVGEGYLTYGGEGNLEVNQVGIYDSEIEGLVWPCETIEIIEL